MNDSTSAISPAWPTRWPADSFKGFWTWFLAGIIALGLIGITLLAIAYPPPTSVSAPEFDALLVVQFAIEGMVVGLVLLVVPALSKFSLHELGFRGMNWRALGIALIGAVAMVLVANGGAALINYLVHSEHQQDIVQIFRGLHDRTTVVLFVFFAIVFAPFAEETIFRLLFFNLGLRYGGFWAGAILSGLLFGIAHGDLLVAIPLALGGMVLCAVYYSTRSIFASMLSHALFNSVSIAALLALPKLTQ